MPPGGVRVSKDAEPRVEKLRRVCSDPQDRPIRRLSLAWQRLRRTTSGRLPGVGFLTSLARIPFNSPFTKAGLNCDGAQTTASDMTGLALLLRRTIM